MTIAQLKFTQGATVGVPGRAFKGALGSGIIIANGDDDGVTSWTYVLLDSPLTSALSPATLSSGGTSSCTFTPDVSGSYRIQSTVSGPSGSASDTRDIVIPNGRGWIIPAFLNTDQELNFPNPTAPNARGWAATMEAILSDIAADLTRLDGGSTTTAVTLTSPFTLPASGATGVAHVTSAAGLVVSGLVQISGLGALRITATSTGSNTVTLSNATSLAGSNATPGTIAATGSLVSPVGPQGPPVVVPSVVGYPVMPIGAAGDWTLAGKIALKARDTGLLAVSPDYGLGVAVKPLSASLPAAWAVEVFVSPFSTGGGSSAGAGVVLTNGTTSGTSIGVSFYRFARNTGWAIDYTIIGTQTRTIVTYSGGDNTAILSSPGVWMRLAYDGTNLHAQYSVDGRFWVDFYAFPPSTAFGAGGAPSNYGFSLSADNSTERPNGFFQECVFKTLQTATVTTAGMSGSNPVLGTSSAHNVMAGESISVTGVTGLTAGTSYRVLSVPTTTSLVLDTTDTATGGVTTNALIVNLSEGDGGSVVTPGQNGSNGKNAFSRSSASVTMPSVGNTVSVPVDDTSWISATGISLSFGTGGQFTVTSIPDATHVVLNNTGASGNAVAGATIAGGSILSPTGAAGGPGGNAFTTTTASFAQPAVGGTVTISVQDVRARVSGETVMISGSGIYSVSAPAVTTSPAGTFYGLLLSAVASPPATVNSGATVTPTGTPAVLAPTQAFSLANGGAAATTSTTNTTQTALPDALRTLGSGAGNFTGTVLYTASIIAHGTTHSELFRINFCVRFNGASAPTLVDTGLTSTSTTTGVLTGTTAPAGTSGITMVVKCSMTNANGASAPASIEPYVTGIAGETIKYTVVQADVDGLP